MIRPLFLVVVALHVAVPAVPAWAQPSAVPVVGVLRTSSFVANDSSAEALQRALRGLGTGGTCDSWHQAGAAHAPIFARRISWTCVLWGSVAIARRTSAS